jgi:hypothetical protein
VASARRIALLLIVVMQDRTEGIELAAFLLSTIARFQQAANEARKPRREREASDSRVISFTLGLDDDRCSDSRSVGSNNAEDGTTRGCSPLTEAFADDAGMLILDPSEVICAEGFCAAHDERTIWYADSNHMNREEAKRLIESFRDELLEFVRESDASFQSRLFGQFVCRRHLLSSLRIEPIARTRRICGRRMVDR